MVPTELDVAAAALLLSLGAVAAGPGGAGVSVTLSFPAVGSTSSVSTSCGRMATNVLKSFTRFRRRNAPMSRYCSCFVSRSSGSFIFSKH